MTTTTCKTSVPFSFGDADQSTFEVCNFLVNVLGNMYNQWTSISTPPPSQADFDWGTGLTYPPVDACSITLTKFNVDDYIFSPLIWSTYTYLGKTFSEPFGSVVQDKAGNLYLVFRGSKSTVDFLVDAQYKPVAYLAPTPNPPSNIEVETGWYKVYTGLLTDLQKELGPYLAPGKEITITGHSLGSTLATLAVPEAIANGMQVNHYNSASPMVGLQSFADYYNSLAVTQTFRLVNLNDTVPNVPNNLQSQYVYVAVGTQISFAANYGEESKNHDPCCCYGYAIWHPDNPVHDGCKS